MTPEQYLADRTDAALIAIPVVAAWFLARWRRRRA
jgi:hypothetical protein